MSPGAQARARASSSRQTLDDLRAARIASYNDSLTYVATDQYNFRGT